MHDKAFLDTNVLVYAYDNRDRRKQEIAQGLLVAGIERERYVISVQVLGEFFNVVTRNINNPMSPAEAQKAISLFSVLPVQEIDLNMVHRAIDTHIEYKISYWDALIVSAAERCDCKSILSEDLNTGQHYHGIVVNNPFGEYQ
ncbi:twitching motility protein PilT [Desulfosarcina ovata subsp. sediminis]|uniref:Twitching motility protein PilT n=1 Tax=Desulfosarcina ovata subsp. sediminis TaxID=885957 RepID=A0A5K7ZWN2_9BACT|nr:PIN domain-containing protein [Desulfosarcina ovata]BBO84665.1 twitching motility protein PilT [Desulfosarcina ovata subsp. sediminis]